GCIPTKAWVQTAFALKEAEETFAKLGVQVGEPTLDLATANEWKAAVVKQMTQGVASLFKANGVEWVKGKGRFTGANTIAVEGGGGAGGGGGARRGREGGRAGGAGGGWTPGGGAGGAGGRIRACGFTPARGNGWSGPGGPVGAGGAGPVEGWGEGWGSTKTTAR